MGGSGCVEDRREERRHLPALPRHHIQHDRIVQTIPRRTPVTAKDTSPQ
jgi:hypothetical protein